MEPVNVPVADCAQPVIEVEKSRSKLARTYCGGSRNFIGNPP
jgi:hypothetical protein